MVAVPAQYASLVQQAAAGTGLPQSVVAAQINEESGFNPNAVSPTGAEGIFQFEPSSYNYGQPAGSEFDPSEEVLAYIGMMKQLLAWSGGNVQKALAAYNAGQGNWQAGLGYANTILANAGSSSSATVTSATTSSSTPTADPASIMGTITGSISATTSLVHDVAQVLNLFFELFEPGQLWRAAFIGIAIVSGLGLVELYAG